MTPDLRQLYAAIDGTWPSAAQITAGPWTLREGRGGGKRVSAATADGPWQIDDLDAAEQAMTLMGQAPLFMIRSQDEDLDNRLAQRGYALVDPVVLWLAPTAQLADRALPPVTAWTIWEPLAIMRELWVAGGIDGARQQVMERAQGSKTGVFGRLNDRPAGTGFCAIHSRIAMVHALEIAPFARGQGLGSWMMRAAAHWAMRENAPWMAVLCTKANAAACGLYASLGMASVGGYHYRHRAI